MSLKPVSLHNGGNGWRLLIMISSFFSFLFFPDFFFLSLSFLYVFFYYFFSFFLFSVLPIHEIKANKTEKKVGRWGWVTLLLQCKWKAVGGCNLLFEKWKKKLKGLSGIGWKIWKVVVVVVGENCNKNIDYLKIQQFLLWAAQPHGHYKENYLLCFHRLIFFSFLFDQGHFMVCENISYFQSNACSQLNFLSFVI